MLNDTNKVPWNLITEYALTDPARKERLLSRARELMTEAGFRIGMSDGGLVTEAKPMIKWDKVNNPDIILAKL